MLLTNFVYFDNGRPIKDRAVLVEEGIITAVVSQYEKAGKIENFDLKGNYLVPGFVDLQVNGGADVFFSNNITEEAIGQIYADHLRRGTTCILPTLISSPLPDILKAIEAVKTYMRHKPGVAGLHLEGPFLNLSKKGAHNPAYIRAPDDGELMQILDAGEGVIKMITVAPELFTDEQIAHILSKDIIISAGHSNITSQQAGKYFSKGVACVTHLFNAMSQFGSREPGLAGAALDADVYAGIIVDGGHCDYAAVRIAHRLKAGRLFLVSDSTFISAKELEMNGIKFIPTKTGFVNAEGNLAGSNITMADAVKNSVNKVGIPLAGAIKMAAEIPLEIIGLSESRGKIKPGFIADLVVLSKKDLSVDRVIKDGKCIARYAPNG